MMILDLVSVLCSFALIPLTILTVGLFIVKKKAIKGTAKQKKRYQKWRKFHIPLGIAAFICGMYHAVFASYKHGWYLSPGKICAVLLIALVLVYILRKHIKHWLLWHRLLSFGFAIALVLHVVLIPVTMKPNDTKGPMTSSMHSSSQNIDRSK